MARKKKNVSENMEDLNLVPFMNMVVCLIPMILAGTALVKIGVVNVNAPKFGQGAATPDDSDEKPLNLTVAVGSDGFRLTATGANIRAILGMEGAVAVVDPADPAAAAAAGPEPVLIPKKGEDYDYVGLYNKMVKVKQQHATETVMNLTAERQTHFMHLISVMDALRVRLEQDSYDDKDAFRLANARIENDKPVLLWPDVVFAVAQ